MARPSDWPERLAAVIADARERPWQRGVHDCGTFVAEAVKAIGGPDIGGGWVGEYDDDASADQVMRRWGEDMEAAVSAAMAAGGLDEVAPAYAMRGDVVLLYNARLPEMVPAICDGFRAVTMGHQGVMQVPRRWAIKAWRVGGSGREGAPYCFPAT